MSDSEEDTSYLALAEHADQGPPVPSLELGCPPRQSHQACDGQLPTSSTAGLIPGPGI